MSGVNQRKTEFRFTGKEYIFRLTLPDGQEHLLVDLNKDNRPDIFVLSEEKKHDIYPLSRTGNAFVQSMQKGATTLTSLSKLSEMGNWAAPLVEHRFNIPNQRNLNSLFLAISKTPITYLNRLFGDNLTLSARIYCKADSTQIDELQNTRVDSFSFLVETSKGKTEAITASLDSSKRNITLKSSPAPNTNRTITVENFDDNIICQD